MMTMIRIAYAIGALICWAIAFTTASGDLMNYIDFAGPENEMGFFICSAFLGIIFAGMAATKDVS